MSPPSTVSPHSLTHRSSHLSHSHAEQPTSLEALSTSCCTWHRFLKLSSLYLGSYVSEQSAQCSSLFWDTGPGQRDFSKSFARDNINLELVMTDSDSNCDFILLHRKESDSCCQTYSKRLFSLSNLGVVTASGSVCTCTWGLLACVGVQSGSSLLLGLDFFLHAICSRFPANEPIYI